MRKLFVLAGLALTAVLALSSSSALAATTCNSTLTGQTVTGDLVVPDNGVCELVNSTVGDDVWVGRGAYFRAAGSQIADRVESNRSLTLFIDTGTTVGDDVEANRTDQVFVFNSTIEDSLEAWRSTDAVQICGNTIGGFVHVHQSGDDILIGDPLAVDCAANTFGGSVDVEDNVTDEEFVIRGNTFHGGDLDVVDNEGPVEKFVQDNTGGDELSCHGNEDPFTASGNAGWNELRGQCAIPPTECNTTLTGQTIPGDLAVPEGGVCRLLNSTVGDDVKVGRGAYFESAGSTIGDDVVAKRALTVFLDTGTTVGGKVRAWRTPEVYAFNSTLNGRVDVSGSGKAVQLCGNTVAGRVSIRHSGTDILIGDPLAVDCAANTFGASVIVEDNFTDDEFVIRGNKFADDADLRVNDNEGPVEKFVQDNTGGDELSCFGNEEPFTASGNTGWDELRGQCAIPPTECNGTLTGQTISGDLVVPEGGACTLVNSTVADDVKVGEDGYLETSRSTIGDDVIASRALTVFLDTGTTVGGDVRVSRAFSVFVFNATIADRIDVDDVEDAVQLCGTSVTGDVSVTDSSQDILIGDPLAVDCAGNTFGDDVRVVNNFTNREFVIRGNAFAGGDLRVVGNDGPVEKFVQNNTGGDELSCFGNDDPFTATGNTFADEEGQCAEI